MPVYAKTLTLHRGVDNQIQFQFLNQDQKPVDITGKEITFRLINYNGREVLLRKALTIDYALTGIASVYLNASDIEKFDAQKAHYSLEWPSGDYGFPVFVDQSAGARGDMDIVNSVLPAFIPSDTITIPTGQPFPNLSNIPNSNTNTTYYSSVIKTEDNPIITIQAHLDQYYGNVSVMGSTVIDTDWYTVETHSYVNTTDTFGYIVKGFHPYIKLQFTSNAGSVTNILAR